jgi:hypothetical protein
MRIEVRADTTNRHMASMTRRRVSEVSVTEKVENFYQLGITYSAFMAYIGVEVLKQWSQTMLEVSLIHRLLGLLLLLDQIANGSSREDTLDILAHPVHDLTGHVPFCSLKSSDSRRQVILDIMLLPAFHPDSNVYKTSGVQG